MNTIGEKKCSNCGQKRPLNFFPFNIKKGEYGEKCLACKKAKIVNLLTDHEKATSSGRAITRAIRDYWFNKGCGICRTCKEILPLDTHNTFFSRSKTTRLGYTYECRACVGERIAEMTRKQKEKKAAGIPLGKKQSRKQADLLKKIKEQEAIIKGLRRES